MPTCGVQGQTGLHETLAQNNNNKKKRGRGIRKSKGKDASALHRAVALEQGAGRLTGQSRIQERRQAPRRPCGLSSVLGKRVS